MADGCYEQLMIWAARGVVAVGAIFVLAVVQARGAEPAGRPLVVGHRGLLRHAPENTLAGFRAALELRVGFEVDIRRTEDGRLVCLHDETLDRTSNGRGPLNESTYDELGKLDVGEWFDASFRGERIPTADEVFALVAQHSGLRTLVAVDLKATGGGVEESLVRLAQEHKVLARLVFIGTTIEAAEVRARLHAVNSETQLARLASDSTEFDAILSDVTADWVYVRFLPSAADTERIHKAGKRLFIAGPLVAGKENENWSRAAALPIDAILTDYPLELEQSLRKSSP
jgi:glycerophosphoryl diester phosphodiesterase